LSERPLLSGIGWRLAARLCLAGLLAALAYAALRLVGAL